MLTITSRERDKDLDYNQVQHSLHYDYRAIRKNVSQTYIHIFFFIPQSEKNWNHAKIIAADGRHILQGGHNFVEDDMLLRSPIHDLSLAASGGSAARIAHEFLNQLWNQQLEASSREDRKSYTEIHSYPGEDVVSQPKNIPIDQVTKKVAFPSILVTIKKVLTKGDFPPSFQPPRSALGLVTVGANMAGGTGGSISTPFSRAGSTGATAEEGEEEGPDLRFRNVPTIPVGRWGGGFGDAIRAGEASDAAIFTLLSMAETSIKLHLQDLGALLPGNYLSFKEQQKVVEVFDFFYKKMVQIWPERLFDALAAHMIEKPALSIQIIQSDAMALSDKSSVLFGHGWTPDDLKRNFRNRVSLVAQQFANHDLRERYGSDRRLPIVETVMQRFEVFTLQYYPEEARWQPGESHHPSTKPHFTQPTPAGVADARRRFGSHPKLIIVDDVVFYLGSQNLYARSDLSEFGYIVDRPDVTQDLLKQLWNPLWHASSQPGLENCPAPCRRAPFLWRRASSSVCGGGFRSVAAGLLFLSLCRAY